MPNIIMNMKKRLYNSPLVEIEWCNTQRLMQVADPSDVPPEPVPARRTEVF